MPKKIFVNLPVKDLDRSIRFFTHLGFTFNPQFTSDTSTCMVVDENIFVMLLTKPFFKTFTPKTIVDAKMSTEVIICLSADSKEEIVGLVNKALEAGGHTPNEAKSMDFMYLHGFEDLDGHLWELAWMSGMPPAAGA